MEEATVRIYLREIIDIVKPRLVERSWEVKRQVCSVLATRNDMKDVRQRLTQIRFAAVD